MNTLAKVDMERRINWAGLAVMVGLVANLCAGSWYASSLSSRVASLESATTAHSTDHELLVRMDERTRVIAEELSEIKKKLQRLR